MSPPLDFFCFDRAGSATAFGNNSAVTLADVAGATLDLNGFNISIGSLAGGGATGGAVTLGAGALTTGGDNTSTSFGGVSGAGALLKIGTGAQTLTGDAAHTGRPSPRERCRSATAARPVRLTASYSFNNGLNLRAGARNLLNADFSFGVFNGPYPFDGQSVHLRGRVAFVEASYDFSSLFSQ